MKYLTKTGTEYVWIPREDLVHVEIFLERKFPNIKFKIEYHESGSKSYLKFKDKKTAQRMQKELVRAGYFKFLKQNSSYR